MKTPFSRIHLDDLTKMASANNVLARTFATTVKGVPPLRREPAYASAAVITAKGAAAPLPLLRQENDASIGTAASRDHPVTLAASYRHAPPDVARPQPDVLPVE